MESKNEHMGGKTHEKEKVEFSEILKQQQLKEGQK